MRISSLLWIVLVVIASVARADDDDKSSDLKDSNAGKAAGQNVDNAVNRAADSARDTAREARDSTKDAAHDAEKSARDSARRGDDKERDSARDNRDRDADHRERSDDRSSRDRDRSDFARHRDDDDAYHSGDRDRDRDDDRDRNRDRDRDYSYDRNDRDHNRSDNHSDRGRLGATFSNDDDRLVISNFGRSSFLSSAGLRRGDAIVSVNGRRVSNQRDFERWVYDSNVRRPYVVVWRDGRERTIYLENVPSDVGSSQAPATLGIVVDTRYSDEVVIRDVHPNSAADRAGLGPGDVLLSIEGEGVANFDDLRGILRHYSAGDKVEIEYQRDNRTRTTLARLDAADNSAPSARYYESERGTYGNRGYVDGAHRSGYRGYSYDNGADWNNRDTVYRDRTVTGGNVHVEEGRRGNIRYYDDGDRFDGRRDNNRGLGRRDRNDR